MFGRRLVSVLSVDPECLTQGFGVRCWNKGACSLHGLSFLIGPRSDAIELAASRLDMCGMQVSDVHQVFSQIPLVEHLAPSS